VEATDISPEKAAQDRLVTPFQGFGVIESTSPGVVPQADMLRPFRAKTGMLHGETLRRTQLGPCTDASDERSPGTKLAQSQTHHNPRVFSRPG
jgi:hypothetical protein